MRSYNIDIVDVNDNIVAFWMNLTEEQLMLILTTVVPMREHFLNVRVVLGGHI